MDVAVGVVVEALPKLWTQARTEELRDFLLANLPFSNEEVRVLTLPFEAERGRTDYRKMIAASQRDAR